jgi:hypothetical protein
MCTPHCAAISYLGRNRSDLDHVLTHIASLDGAAAVRQQRAKRSWCRAPLDRCAKASLLEVSSARNVRINVDFAWFLGIRTLRVKNAHCAKVLILPRFSLVRPGRNVRLLSCHRSVGVLLLAVPARPFAKLRLHKIRTKRLGEGFAAESLQSMWGVLGGRTGASGVARSTEARPRERQLQCLCFADRAQEDDKQTGFGRTS